MKDNKIDDLFRQRLGHQKLTPPPSAWAAVEQNLAKKKKGFYFWISMAASILLICTLSWIVLRGDGMTTPNNQVLSANEHTDEINKDATKIESLQADSNNDQTKTTIPQPVIKEPVIQKLVAASDKQKIKRPFRNQKLTENMSEIQEPTSIERESLMIAPLNLTENLSVATTVEIFDFDMVMPLVLSDYYIMYNEEIELAPKKKRFRVLNGIISIAKEVNNSKLSFSELRNRKNNFVTDDLKYGTKAEEKTEDDSEDELNKD